MTQSDVDSVLLLRSKNLPAHLTSFSFVRAWLTRLRPECTNVVVTATQTTPTPTPTPTSTTTTTTTTTPTPTPTPTPPSFVNDCPSSPYNPGAFFGDSYTIYCNAVCNTGQSPIGTSTQPKFTSCVYYCDNNFALGFEANYDSADGLCQCYGSVSNSIQSNQSGRSCAVINGLGIPGGN